MRSARPTWQIEPCDAAGTSFPIHHRSRDRMAATVLGRSVYRWRTDGGLICSRSFPAPNSWPTLLLSLRPCRSSAGLHWYLSLPFSGDSGGGHVFGLSDMAMRLRVRAFDHCAHSLVNDRGCCKTLSLRSEIPRQTTDRSRRDRNSLLIVQQHFRRIAGWLQSSVEDEEAA